jgi:hypothetical protein
MSKRMANPARILLTAGAMFALAVSSTATAATLALSSSTPAGGATDSARTGSLQLNFSVALNPATVSSSAVTLSSAAGNQIVTVSASGSRITVSPRTKLSALTSYTLRLSNSIRGSGGEQMSAPLTVSFTTRDASWQTSQLLETQTTPATSPTVAAAGDKLMVAWRQDTSISVNRYVSGTGWSGSESINLGVTAEELQSVIDPQGTLHAVWAFAESATVRSLRSVRYTPGVGFSAVQDVETLNAGRTVSPSIGVDATGNVVAAWQHIDPANGRGQIFSSRYVPGSAWVASPRLDSAIRSIDPRVVLDAAGNALAVGRNPIVTILVANSFRAATPLEPAGRGQ